MFHVEQRRFLSIMMVLASIFGVFGCKKPPENPVANDGIYNDYASQLAATQGALAKVEGSIKETEQALQKTHPQSPQVKYFEAKILAAREQEVKLKQQIRYWGLKMQSRQVHVTYLTYKTFYEDKPVDSLFVAENTEYTATKKLRQAKAIWDQKERVGEFEKGIRSRAPAAQGAGHGEPAREGHH